MTMIGNNDVDPLRDHYIKLGKVLKQAGCPGEDFHRLETLWRAAKDGDAMREDMKDLMERLAPYEAPEDAPDPYDKLNAMRRENKRLRDALREAAAELGRVALAFDSKDDRAKRLRNASTRAHDMAGDGFSPQQNGGDDA